VRKLGRVPALDGIRGVAILAVMVYHLFLTTGGLFGVSLFFVLSGFLITGLLVDEWELYGRISRRSFYARRLRRLGPALTVTLLAFLLLTVATDPHRIVPALLGAVIGAASCANLVVAFGHGFPKGLVHLWSLSLEEQFYLVWPTALVVALRCRVRPGAICSLLLAGAIAVTVYGLGLAALGASPTRLYFAPDTSCAPLLVGCACALLIRRRPTGQLPVWVKFASALAFPVLIGWLCIGGNVSQFGPAGAIAPVFLLGFALISGLIVVCVAWDHRQETAVSRLLSVRWLVAVGKVSYGLYLYHSLLVILLPAPAWVAELLSVPLAFGSYHLIEKRFLVRRPSRRAEARVVLPSLEREHPDQLRRVGLLGRA
jgi:peptidoglycan/LPS O-acetylase OafA/YrhL